MSRPPTKARTSRKTVEWVLGRAHPSFIYSPSIGSSYGAESGHSLVGQRMAGIGPLTAAALSSVLADSVDELFGHRTLLARELIHTGAQVRTQLASRVSDIADLAELVEGVTVVLEDRRWEEFSGAD